MRSITGRILPLLVVLTAAILVSACAVAQSEAVPLEASPIKGRVDPALLSLHKEYLAFADALMDNETFSTRLSNVSVVDGRILVDATAMSDGKILEQDLLNLGAEIVATRNKIVTCWFPIRSIPGLESLESLQFVRPVYVTTR